MLQSLFYLTTALHVSAVTLTHVQEHNTTVTTASSNRYSVLLSAAIVEELELILLCCGWRIDVVNVKTCRRNMSDNYYLLLIVVSNAV
jgi:hypothetical protein